MVTCLSLRCSLLVVSVLYIHSATSSQHQTIKGFPGTYSQKGSNSFLKIGAKTYGQRQLITKGRMTNVLGDNIRFHANKIVFQMNLSCKIIELSSKCNFASVERDNKFQIVKL